MSQLLINPMTPEEQQRIMGQMYALLGKQVKRYHKHHHMGENTSVPVELAQELMESIDYTLELTGGIFGGMNLEEALGMGQEILEERTEKARSMLELVMATAPKWQTEFRWEALRYLRHYLDVYDHLHLAHRSPDDLFYPILISPPEGLRGIDCCIFYLNIMWIENQIMAGIPDDVLEQLWDRIPPETLNQCEQVLTNGMGKAILGAGIEPLVFEPCEHIQILRALMDATEDSLRNAAELLCDWLNLRDDNARTYVNAVLPLLTPWINGGISGGNIGSLFV